MADRGRSKQRRSSAVSSIASSVRSTNSDQSYDSSGIPGTEPLIQERGPPPAYTPAAPGPSSTEGTNQNVVERNRGVSYGTIREPSRSFEPELYEASDEASEDEVEDYCDQESQRTRSCGKNSTCGPRCSRRTIRNVVLILGSVFLGLLVCFALGQVKSWSENAGTSEEEIAWPKCEDVQITHNQSFEFPQATSFSLHEQVQSAVFSEGTIIGKVFVTKGDSDQEAAVRVNTFMHSSSLTFLEHVSFAQEGDGLRISSTNAPVRDKKCTVINLLVSIGESHIFDNVTLHTKHLSLDTGSKLGLETDKLFLKSISGDVTLSESHASRVESKHIEVETFSSSIKGKYPLNDLLSISTQSGSVNVDFEPQSEEQSKEEHLRPAILKVSSSTGKVVLRNHIKQKEIPLRDYQTQITTFSGSIDGSILHGSSTELDTTSGSLEAEILPVITGSKMNSTLHTGATFSHTDLNILSPLASPNCLKEDSKSAAKAATLLASTHGKDSMLRNMKSKHETVSGSMRLRYPSEWEGSITGESLSGGVDVAGKGVDVKKRARRGKEIHAMKGKQGDDKSTLRFGSVTGSGEVLVGEPE